MIAAFSASPLLFLGLALVFVLSGGIAGVLAGLFGIGGGIIMVPAMSTIFQHMGASADHAMRLAVATSLATIIPTSIASLRAHHKRQGIDWPLLKLWLPIIIVGAFIGSYLTRYISGKALSLLFGLLLAFMAIRFLKPQAAEAEQVQRKVGKVLQSTFAFTIGCSSAMLGVGGGVLGVPALCYVGLPLKRAIGTASTFGLMVAIPGVFNYLLAATPPDVPLGGSWGLIHPLALALLIPGAVLGAPLGARLTHSLPVAKLRRGFAVLVVLLALKMLYTSLS